MFICPEMMSDKFQQKLIEIQLLCKEVQRNCEVTLPPTESRCVAENSDKRE
jgi:hypothetical protein